MMRAFLKPGAASMWMLHIIKYGMLQFEENSLLYVWNTSQPHVFCVYLSSPYETESERESTIV